MNRSVGSRTTCMKTRNCRNLLACSRVRRQVMAENFDRQWKEIRRQATIERDPKKLAKLVAARRSANCQDASQTHHGV